MTIPAAPLWLLLLLLPGTSVVFAALSRSAMAETLSRGMSLATVAVALLLLDAPASGSFGSILEWDSTSRLFALLVAAIYALSTFYSSAYLAPLRPSRITPSQYYALLSGFAVAMLLTLAVSDLAIMWIGLEATTVLSALLIVYDRHPASVEASWRYTLLASAGLTIGLFGLVTLYSQTGTLDAFALATHPPAMTAALALVVGLALVGFGTKVGLFPMHSWLPDAHSEAPAPVSALFSGVLLPTALYVFLRVYDLLPSAGASGIRELVVALGALTAVIAALLTLAQRSYKRLFAYSSMENMGIAVVGIGLGGMALYGALLLIVAHAFAKSSAFYCSGNALRATGTSQIAGLRGLRYRLPVTSTLWVLAGLAVTGAPPFGSFAAELVILTGAVGQGAYGAAIAVGFALLVAFVGVNFAIGRMVFSEPEPDAPPTRTENWASVVPTAIALSVALLVGVVALPYLAPALRMASGGAFP
jgi:hydrogenase-4 component F